MFDIHLVPGPQGLGSQGSGFKTHLKIKCNMIEIFTGQKGKILLLVLTDVISSRTIRISNTFRFATSDGVRVGNQSRFTSTDGIARRSNSTSSSRSTRAWHTRIWTRNTFL